MTEKDVAKISAMVEFYSDRAVAHASFFLASLFGLFGVLALAGNQNTVNKCIWAVPYWLLFLGSLYTYANFSLYATYAQRITEQARMHEVKQVRDGLEEARKNLILKWLQFLKDSFYGWRLIVGGFLYVVIAFLSCWMVIGFDQAIGGFIVVSAIIAVSWLYVLYRY